MTDNKKLIYTLVMQNEKYLKENERNKRSMLELQKVSGKSIGQITKDFKSLNTSAAKNFNKFGKASNDSFGRFGRGAGQASVQLQQFVGQVQAGTNPLLAFSQQAADVGVVLGAPLLGAILGIGAAIGMTLAPRLGEAIQGMFDIRDSATKLKMALEELDRRVMLSGDGVLQYTDRIKNLAKVSKAAAQVELQIAIVQAEIAIKEATAGIVTSIKEIESRFQSVENRSGRMKRGIQNSMTRIREEFGLTEAQAEQFRAVSKTALEDPTIENISAFNNLAISLDLGNEKLRDFVTTLNTNLETFNQSKTAAEQLKQAFDDLGATSDVQSFFEDPEKVDPEEDRIRKSIKAKLEQAEKEEQIQKRRIESLKSFTAQNLAILVNAFGEESAIGKAAFLAQQAIAIPEMIVATEQAAVQALTLGPIAGPIASAAIRGLGYAAIGVVAGQTIASFEGGGRTPQGPRVGGMDGRGGQLAMLHPNEKVIDLSRDFDEDKWTINVINNGGVSVKPDIDEEQRVVSIMIDQARPGRPFMNALQQNSNIESQGSRR